MASNNNIPEEYIKLLIEASVDTAMERVDRKLDLYIKNLAAAAFPSGNADHHRLWHEEVDERERRCQTWKERVIGHFTVAGAIATIGWIIIALVSSARAQILDWLK